MFGQLNPGSLSEVAEADELQVLIDQMCDELGTVIDAGAANILARQAQGSPKAAKSLLRRIRDYTEVEFDGRITKEVVYLRHWTT